jgi:hypothetical protein
MSEDRSILHATPDEELFRHVHAVMAGINVMAAVSGTQDTRSGRDFQSLYQAFRLLEQRVTALEAERGRGNQSHLKCPQCGGLSLKVIATGSHPEFGDLGMEQHQVSCGYCSHTGHQLYDPTGYLR